MTVEIDNSGGAAIERQGPNSRWVVLYNRVDFSKAANYLATTLSMGVLKVPAGVKIIRAFMNVLTADTDVTDVDLGIEGADEDGFQDGATLATTGLKEAITAAYQVDGVGYSDLVNDQVIALKNNDADTINQAKIDFFAWGIDLRNPND